MLINFFSPSLFCQVTAGKVRERECNSSGQTLIFSRFFPPVTQYVDITHDSEFVLGLMDICLRREGIISLKMQSAGGTAEERSHFSPIFFQTEPNALLKGFHIYSLPLCSYIRKEVKSCKHPQHSKNILWRSKKNHTVRAEKFQVLLFWF